MRNLALLSTSLTLLSVLTLSPACSSDDDTVPNLEDGTGGKSPGTGARDGMGGEENTGGSGPEATGGMGGETTSGGSAGEATGGGDSSGGMGGEATGGGDSSGGSGSGGSAQTIEDCNDGFDNNDNGDIDCADTECIAAPSCIFDCTAPPPYVPPHND